MFERGRLGIRMKGEFSSVVIFVCPDSSLVSSDSTSVLSGFDLSYGWKSFSTNAYSSRVRSILYDDVGKLPYARERTGFRICHGGQQTHGLILISAISLSECKPRYNPIFLTKQFLHTSNAFMRFLGSTEEVVDHKQYESVENKPYHILRGPCRVQGACCFIYLIIFGARKL